MSELHARFAAWIGGGSADDLPRAVAIHASGCPECLALAAGLDALRAIDVGAADEPPIIPEDRSIMPIAGSVGRVAAGMASIAFLVAAIVVGFGLVRPASNQTAGAPTSATPSPSIAEGVLGGVAPTSTPTPSPSVTPTPTPTSILPTPPPPTVVPAGPISTPAPAPAPPLGTPRATAAITPRPPTAAPTPSPAPTPVPPTAAPTPVPTLPPRSILPSIPAP